MTTAVLIATISTGFLGINLIAAADDPLPDRILFFMLVLIPSALLTGYAVVKSKRLSDFLEALSDERLSSREKLSTLATVWRKKKRSSDAG